MSFAAMDASVCDAAPYKLYWFAMGSLEWCLAASDEPRVYMTKTFTPAQIVDTEIELNKEANAGTIEITLPLESEIASLFMAGFPPAPIWVNVYEGHDGDAELLNTFSGKIVKSTMKDECVLTVSGDGVAMRKKIPGPVYQQSCNRRLYSPGCGAVEADHKFDVTIATISDDRLTITYSSIPALIYWDSHWDEVGDNAKYPSLAAGKMQDASGRWYMIETHTAPTVFTLKSPLHQSSAVGDAITLYKGCRRNLKHCKYYGREKYFMGFDVMPTRNPSSQGLG